MAKLEDLFPQPVDVLCPDAGPVPMRPYITSAAMDALLRFRREPARAVEAALGELVAGGVDRVRTLSDRDRQTLMRRLAAIAEAEGDFDEARKRGLDAADSLMDAIQKTEMWSDAARHQANWERTMKRFANPFGLAKAGGAVPALGLGLADLNLSQALRTIAGTHSLAWNVDAALPAAMRDLAAAARVRDEVLGLRPTFDKLLGDLQRLRGTTAFASLASLTAGLPRPAYLDPTATALLHLDHLRLVHDRVTSLGGVLDAANDALVRLPAFAHVEPSLVQAMRSERERVAMILQPIPTAERLFRDAVAATGSTDRLGEAFRLATEGLLAAAGPVTLANEFFGRPYALPELRLPVAPPHDRRRPSDGGDEGGEVESASPAAIVYQASSELVATGNSVASLLLAKIEAVAEAVGEQVDERIRTMVGPYLPLLERIQKLSAPETMGELLRNFGTMIARDHWRELWDVPGVKFKTRPEYLVKMVLAGYLSGHYNGAGFVGQELQNGAGFIDLLVNVLGVDHVLELKMVGGSYGPTYAMSGAPQLDQYLQNFRQPRGYLVIFDGRKTTAGQQFPAQFDGQHGVIEIIVVRCYFEPPTGER